MDQFLATTTPVWNGLIFTEKRALTRSSVAPMFRQFTPGGHAEKPSKIDRWSLVPRSMCWYSAPTITSASTPLTSMYSKPTPAYQPEYLCEVLSKMKTGGPGISRVEWTSAQAPPPSPKISQLSHA